VSENRTKAAHRLKFAPEEIEPPVETAKPKKPHQLFEGTPKAKNSQPSTEPQKPGSESKAIRLHFPDQEKPQQRLNFADTTYVQAPDASYRKAAKLVTPDNEQDEEAQDNPAVDAVDTGACTARKLSDTTHQYASRLKEHKTHPGSHDASATNSTTTGQGSNVNQTNAQRSTNQGTTSQGSNPLSRWRQKMQQRKQIRSNYVNTGSQTGKATRTASQKVGKRVSSAAKPTSRGVLLVALGFMLIFILNGVGGCVPLVQTTLQAFVIGTYPASEDDVKAAERAYAGMESTLEQQMDNYASVRPGYDEYVMDVDDIWHDPYALIAIISARHNGEEWTIDTAYPTIERYFELQYIITEEVVTETRYRTETQTVLQEVVDPESGEIRLEPVEEDVEVPYEYTICKVTLENKNLSHLPVYTMSRTQLGLYALYMSTLGNMPDLFKRNPHASELKDPLLHDVPQAYLDADPQFAALLAEAELYLGYPYVWGGDSPDTSFDCSGFISWVFTNSGVYNTGRLGATSLYGICQPIRADQARPGDLIFFEGTIAGEEGITHVGLYVGDGMMLHCGNPISYADLSESYWQSHFFGYGRVPY